MLLPSKLVCYRVGLSQPALMSKIVSVHDARFDGGNRTRGKKERTRGKPKRGEKRKRNVEIISRENERKRKTERVVCISRGIEGRRKRTIRKRGTHVRRERERENRHKERDGGTRTLYPSTGTEMKIPFAVWYIKLVVECFESYHSHFVDFGPQNRSSGKHIRVRCTSALSAPA